MRSRRPDETGATAILVALLCVVLFGMGAFAVDLGNAYARKRDLQTNVDLAVLAAAAELPDQSAATAVAEEYLEANWVYGQGEPIAWDLGSPSTGDGWLEFEADGNPWKVRLYAPKARVDFGFAAVAGFGGDDPHVDVPAQAAVELRSPGKVGPFYMLSASECSFGPQRLKAGPGSADDTEDDDLDVPTTWVPAGPLTNNDFEVTRVTSLEVEEGITGQRILLEGTTKNAVAPGTLARLLFNSSDAVESVAVSPEWSGSKQNGRYPWGLELIVPSSVADSGGTWWVRLERLDTGDVTGQDTAAPFSVDVGTDTEDKCGEKSTGDFGIVDSPRDGSYGEKEEYALNVQYGLDHPVGVHLSPGELGEECADTDALDDETLPEGEPATCLNTGGGMKTAYVTEGLFGGYSAAGPDGEDGEQTGLLRQPTTEYCEEKGPLVPMPVGDYTDVNADTLECFLESGGDVESLSSSSYAGGPVLASEIFDSPRFLWVPLLNADANPKVGGFFPVVGYRAVFITEIRFNGGGKSVHTIDVVAIHPNALPETIARPEEGISYVGSGSKLLRLVE